MNLQGLVFLCGFMLASTNVYILAPFHVAIPRKELRLKVPKQVALVPSGKPVVPDTKVGSTGVHRPHRNGPHRIQK